MPNNSDGYNGWTNYETWCWGLWYGEPEFFEDEIHDAVVNNWDDDDAKETQRDATTQLAKVLKEFTEESVPELDDGFFCDMLNTSLNEVNWYEIAEHYVADYIADNEATLAEIMG